MAGIETKKFQEMVDAIGADTIAAIATAGPEMQVGAVCVCVCVGGWVGCVWVGVCAVSSVKFTLSFFIYSESNFWGVGCAVFILCSLCSCHCESLGAANTSCIVQWMFKIKLCFYTVYQYHLFSY